jgi:hypothetical protein
MSKFGNLAQQGESSHSMRKYQIKVEQIMGMRCSSFYLALLAMVISVAFVCPPFWEINPNLESWKTVYLKAYDLTHNLEHIDPYSHNAKKVFRLTVPAAIRVFNLNPISILALEGLAGLLFFYFFYHLANRILKDAFSASMLTMASAFVYFGRAAFFDVNHTWFDGFAYFFLLLSLYFRQGIFIFLFSFLAAWTDERALIALSLVFVFHLLDSGVKFLGGGYRIPQALAVIIAGFFYLAMRYYLGIKWGMETPTTGANLLMLGRTIHALPLGIWTFLEGFWFCLIAVLYFLIKNRNWLTLAGICIPLFCLIIVSGFVSDATRSGSYLFPVVFSCILILRQQLTTSTLQKTAFAVLLVSFFFPAVIVCIDWPMNMWFQSSGIPLVRHFLDFLAHKWIYLN